MINNFIDSLINNNDIYKIKKYINIFLNPIKYYLIILLFIFIYMLYILFKINNNIEIIINNLILLKKINN